MFEMSKRWAVGLLVVCAGPLSAALPEEDVQAPEVPETTRTATVAPSPRPAASPAGPVLTVEDARSNTRVTIGALGTAPAGALGDAARAYLLDGPQGARWRTGGLTVTEVQDGTPVRLVRLRSSEGVVQVTFGAGPEVIGVAVSPGAAAQPSSPAVPVDTAARQNRRGGVYASLPDGEVTPSNLPQSLTRLTSTTVDLTDMGTGDALEGAWFHAQRRNGPSARAASGAFTFDPRPSMARGQVEIAPDFLEANAYHHASRGRREVAAYGAGPRYDAIVGRLGLVVDEDRTASGRAFSGNAVYNSYNHLLAFARQDAFPSAADGTVVTHELGHAVWHALAGTEPDKRNVTVPENAVYEGWADAFAALVTEDPQFGRWWIGATGERPRDSRNTTRFDPKSEDGHAQGVVYSGLLWDLSRGRSKQEWRQLVMGSLQLAPQPVQPASLIAGLLLADRTFHGGRHARQIVAAARARAIPCEIAE